MDKKNYYTKLMGVYDTINEKMVLTGFGESLGGYTRQTIPVLQKEFPLKDLKIAELGEINIFTGEIKPEKMKLYEWQDLYKFNITNKAVENESETATESDKQ